MRNKRYLLQMFLMFSLFGGVCKTSVSQLYNPDEEEMMLKEFPEDFELFLQKLDEGHQLTNEEQERLLVLKDETRATIAAKTEKAAHGADNIKFAKTAHSGANQLYAGAAGVDKGKGALVRSSLKRNAKDGKHIIEITPLADKAKVNGAKEADSPLKNKKIAQLALAGMGKTAMPLVIADGDKNIYLLKNNGTEVLKNEKAIKDVNGQDITAVPFFIGGTPATMVGQYVYAGVHPVDGELIKDPGIAIFSVENPGLKQLDPANFEKGADIKALQVRKKAFSDAGKDSKNIHLAFFKDKEVKPIGAAVIAGGEMFDSYYNPNLQRLFLGFDSVERDDDKKVGGVFSVLVAGIQTMDDGTRKGFVKPIVASPEADFFAGNNKNVIGFHADGTKVFRAATYRVQGLHTPTGKDYLITVGGVEDNVVGSAKPWVNALPVMPAGHPNAGQLAHVDNCTFGLIGEAGQLPVVDRNFGPFPFNEPPNDPASNNPLVVGQHPAWIVNRNDAPIQDVNVFGDCVYVSVNGTDNSFEGIFQSCPLYNEGGCIRNWTPWQRVTPPNPVNGFGMDHQTGNLQWLIGTPDSDILRSTAWGKSENITSNPNDNHELTSELGKLFPDGVFSVFDFDGFTPSFNNPGDVNSRTRTPFSMLVAVGGDRVALIEAQRAGAPTAKFAKNANIFVFDGTNPTRDGVISSPVLKGLAPITSATILQSDVGDKGYLFVAGCGGVARLELVNNSDGGILGDGWKKLAQLASNAAPIKNFNFVEIPEFAGIDARGLCSVDKEGVNVIGTKKFAVFDGSKQAVENITVAEKVVFFTDAMFGLDLACSKFPIFSTTQGLFIWDNFAKEPRQITGFEGTPIKLQFIPDGPGQTKNGNLLVLAVDRDKDTARVYRYDVQGTNVKQVMGADGRPLVQDLREFRHSFFRGGSQFFSTRNASSDTADLLRITTDTDQGGPLDDLIEIDKGDDKFIGTPVRDSASGAWIVPGSWGVRVNE